ncbi:MAG: 23S rRNA (guanosine(2251)-2'-O)-methyltransferase RlmB [Oscillospiraceae bacterium]|nr:23S rRNA (guanosine(2251)-2'-O)-methyltransferase RlmB [Oscillospiraceae bacterium]
MYNASEERFPITQQGREGARLDYGGKAQVEGRRAVAEALRAGREVDKLYVLRAGDGLGALVSQARQAGATVVWRNREHLDAMSLTHAHQGVIAAMAAWQYHTLDDMLAAAAAKGESPFLVICDGVEDPGNLGSIMRTAEAAGAHGLLLPRRRSAGLSPQTAKASCGALEYLPVARVPGVPALLRELKSHNIWIYGADAADGLSVYDTEFSGGVALVFGAEGRGLSHLAKEQCDFLVRIPMRGKVSSLGVAAAAAVVAFTVVKNRLAHSAET